MRLALPLTLLCLSATPALAAPQDRGEQDTIAALRVHIEHLEDLPAEQRDDTWQTRLHQARYHFAVRIGGVEAEEPAYFQQVAMGVLEELIFEAGEGSAIALHCYRALGDIYAAQERWEEASEFYAAVAHRLLGEPGDEPRRLQAIPFPEIGEAPAEVEEIEEEPVEEDILQPVTVHKIVFEDTAIEVDPETLEPELTAALARWEESRTAEEAQLRYVAVEVLAHRAVGTAAEPRANLVVGDLRAATGQHELAARHYRAALEALTDPAPGGDGTPGDSSGD